MTQRAQAQLAEAQDNRNDLIIRAPFAGTVVTRTAEPGEVVTAGTAIVTLLDLHKVYLRGFVPEGQIGEVKVGQAARVYLDSDPIKPIDAYVSRIDPQATFTPENTYFRDDRVKQVVGIKLQLKAGIRLRQTGHARRWRNAGLGRQPGRKEHAQMTAADPAGTSNRQQPRRVRHSGRALPSATARSKRCAASTSKSARRDLRPHRTRRGGQDHPHSRFWPA